MFQCFWETSPTLDMYPGHNSLYLKLKAKKKDGKTPISTHRIYLPFIVLKQVWCQQQSLKAKQTINFSFLPDMMLSESSFHSFISPVLQAASKQFPQLTENPGSDSQTCLRNQLSISNSEKVDKLFIKE